MRAALVVCVLILSNSIFGQNLGGTDLGLVVKAVNDALVEAQSNNPNGFPELTGVTLELSGTATKSANGQVKFLIFSIGPSVQSDQGMTLTFKLTVPSTKNKPTAASVSEKDFKSALAAAITSAKLGFTQINSAAGAAPALKKLTDANIQLSVKFAVQKSVSGGVDTAQLLPVGLSLTGKIQSQLVQTVNLVFGQ
jgi:hypothetical protein